MSMSSYLAAATSKMRNAVLFILLAVSAPAELHASSTLFPDRAWQTADPATSGWSIAGLRRVEAQFRDMGSSALVIVQDGRIIAQWGEADRRIKIASMRKSFLSALYGIAVDKRQVDLDATMAALQIDDMPSRLTETEKQATVRDLLMGRSGIYHVAAAESPVMKRRRPERGSHDPGAFWYYNNWDFNVLGAILRKATGEDTFAAVEQHLARPLGMQHFTARDGEYASISASRYPAYHMYFTAHDLARFGWLFLNRGRWKEQQVVPAAWVAESTRPWTPNARPGVAYGYMWWAAMNDRHFGADMGPGAFSARGFGGQYIVIAPAHNIVIVHLNDIGENDKLESRAFNELMTRVFAAAPR
jgi:CubicO group peptidase (beta-lactamase class C family)